MAFSKFSRRVAVALAVGLVVVACGGSDDMSQPGATDSSQAVPESVTSSSVESTEEELAIGRLDVTLLQLGVEDFATTADCVVDRLRSEGIGVAEEGPQLIAALRCEPSVGTQLFGALSVAVPATSGVCVVEGLTNAAADVPLEEAEAFFSAVAPPNEILQSIAADCDVSIEELEQAFG